MTGDLIRQITKFLAPGDILHAASVCREWNEALVYTEELRGAQERSDQSCKQMTIGSRWVVTDTERI